MEEGVFVQSSVPTGDVVEDPVLDLLRLRLQHIAFRAERDCLRAQAKWQAGESTYLRENGVRRVWTSAKTLLARLHRGKYLPPPPPPIPRQSTRPLIAVIVDAIDWSFANIAAQMRKYLSDDFEFHIVASVELENDFVLAFYLAQNCDLIHLMWRESAYEARALNPRSVALYFGSVDALNERVSAKTTFTVYDHLFSLEADVRKRAETFNDHAIGYAVCSQKIWDLYSSIPQYPPPSALVRDGVDLALFKSENLDRLGEVPSRALRIGWVGNSNCANDVFSDLKGFHTILEPAINEVIAEGHSVEKVYADRQRTFIPHTAMPNFYNTIDVLVCTSAIEGTPNPVLEAMACGVPIISTDVGVVPDVFGELQKSFILARRDVACLKEAIIRLRRECELLVDLSKENLVMIQDWDWSSRIESYRGFFHQSLEKIKSRHPAKGGISHSS